MKLGYKFLEKASEYGDAFSLFCLAEMYEKGEYVKRFFHAVQLYEQAEENGDDEAAEWIKENKTVVELIDEVVDISKATEYNDELWCRIYKIFEEAPQFPEVLRCVYLLYPVIKTMTQRKIVILEIYSCFCSKRTHYVGMKITLCYLIKWQI